MATLYDRLGVPTGASSAEIRAAYRRLARDVHPDHRGGGADGDLTRRMADLNDAWSVLSDPARRRAYDDGLVQHGYGSAASTAAGYQVYVEQLDDEADSWPSWDPEGLDPRGRILRWMLVAVVTVVAVGLAALFLYAFTASPRVVEDGLVELGSVPHRLDVEVAVGEHR